MSLDPPTYLASLQSNIRQRPIPWDGAVRAGTITEDQLARIRAVDKAKKPEARREIVESDLDGYRLLFVGEEGKPSALEKAGKNAPNVIHYILVLLGDLLQSASICFPFLLGILCSSSADTLRAHPMPSLIVIPNQDLLTVICCSRPVPFQSPFQG